MGEATDQVRPVSHTAEELSDPDREATEIRSGIEETRANLSETIDALQDKLDPARLAEQVKDQIREKATDAYDSAKTAVKEATIGKVEKMVSSVTDTVNDVTERAGTAVRESSSSAVQYVRDNPFPFVLIGAGLGMLAWNKRRTEQSPYGSSYSSGRDVGAGRYSRYGTSGHVSTTEPSFSDRARDVASGVADTARGAASTIADSARSTAERATSTVNAAASSVRDAASNAAETARQQLNYVSDQAQQGARVARDRFQDMLQENPIALGVAALAAGALVGLTVPSTRVEGEYMGEARDRLVNQAKSVAQDAAGKVQRVAEEAGRTVKDAAQKEGLVAALADPASTS